MKWPFVRRSTYEKAVAEARLWKSEHAYAAGAFQPAVARTQTVTVSDAQVQQVVAAIDRAADEIVAAVKSVP
jgi:hypothetical protein